MRKAKKTRYLTTFLTLAFILAQGLTPVYAQSNARSSGRGYRSPSGSGSGGNSGSGQNSQSSASGSRRGRGSGGSGGSGSGGSGGTGSPSTSNYQVFAFNDLGMHCYDSDFSVAALLPPFNVLRAQVLLKGQTPQFLDSTKVNLTYEAVADPTGSINQTSIGKSNFWTYVNLLFGASLTADTGLLGQKMPGAANTPQPFASPYEATMRWFGAEGIPITAFDDANKRNTLPLMRVTAKDRNTGAVLSYLDTVVPASDEMNCAGCHVTGGAAANQATGSKYGIGGWSTNSNNGIQVKENVLILHDGINKTTLMANQPVLCASCHYSPALDLDHTGPQGDQVGKPYLSRAMHQRHGKTIAGAVPDASHPAIITGKDTNACYLCHPGATTKCLRGAMATAGLNCQSCHGDLLAVGGYYKLANGQQREPWNDLPKCQSCHTGDAVSHQGGSLILTQAYSSSDPAATPLLATNKRFAESDTTLYRFSQGHNGVACEACHGSPHAIWPTRNGTNDNITATQIQGHPGIISECTACHGAGLPRTLNGPHGMHNVNDPNWYNGGHEGFAQGNNCKTCHGTDGLGTVLSEAKADRSFTVEGRTRTVAQGTPVSCTLCHSNYINGD